MRSNPEANERKRIKDEEETWWLLLSWHKMRDEQEITAYAIIYLHISITMSSTCLGNTDQ